MTTSLVCDCLFGIGPDIRDIIVHFAIVHASAVLAGVDASALFERVIAVAPPDMAKSLRDFINRKDEEKSMSAFWLEVKYDKDGSPRLAQRNW